MSLAAGTRIGPYDIVAPLGAGGMGEVYRARDTRLSREVAIKTLPTSFAADADRLRRFEQEARSTGQLNHPNILAVFDVGSHEGSPYVVSEMLEGETLRVRIGGTPLPMRKAVDYATQVARGLAAAHEKGIVHRDLKPDNLFVTNDGRVKILDFGLAKLLGEVQVQSEAETHTAPVPGTDAGKVLGTVGYMSPEQVRARPVDHRSDIFSFGAVFYEMLSGRRAFHGSSAVETMNAILKEDPPPLSGTNRQLPPALERIVSHCLEKSPEERFQSAHDIAFDLEQLSSTSAYPALAPEGARRGARRGRLAAAALAAVAALAVAYRAGRGSGPPPVVSFRPITFQNGWVTDARFGPDGKQVFYQAQWPNAGQELYVAQIGSPESRALGVKATTLGGASKNGELLITHDDGTLAQVPIGGGAPRVILAGVTEADWGPDGTQVAVLHLVGARHRLEYPIGKLLYESLSLKFPRVAPSGTYVAFSEHPFVGDFRGDIAIVDLDGKKRTLSADWSDIRGLAWSADAREIWFTATRAGSDNSLWAVTLDGVVRPLFRAPGSLAMEDVSPDGRVLLSVQRRRPMIYGSSGDGKERDLSWLDYGIVQDLSRDGKTLLFSEQGAGGGAEYSTYVRGMDGSLPVRLGKGAASALSPDGTLALVTSLTVPMQSVLLPTGAGAPRPLPRGPLVQIQGGAFLPDGKRIVVCGNAKDRPARLFIQDIAGGEPRPISEEGVFVLSQTIVAMRDGRFVFATAADGRPRLYPTDGAGGPRDIKGSEPGDVPLQVPDDGRAFFLAPLLQPSHIFRLDLASGKRETWRVIGREVGNPAARVATSVLSGDGRSYAYTFRDDTSMLYLAEGLR